MAVLDEHDNEYANLVSSMLWSFVARLLRPGLPPDLDAFAVAELQAVGEPVPMDVYVRAAYEATTTALPSLWTTRRTESPCLLMKLSCACACGPGTPCS